ncbi:hypothetical protein [Archaeoglobus neptunius]|uniref:hypothetical protein n=1 Tax=Archaeoglobus neptunius TaxID=2798580 RepID=UPI0019255E4C|nr:hypothetical protein [Archaeoglobus neptunius]
MKKNLIFLIYGFLIFSSVFIPKRIIDWLYAEQGFVSESIRLGLSAASSVFFVVVVLFIAERQVGLGKRHVIIAGAFLALLICMYLYFFEFVTGGD